MIDPRLPRCKCGTIGITVCLVHNEDRILVNEATDLQGAEWLLHLASKLANVKDVRVRLDDQGTLVVIATTDNVELIAERWHDA